MSLIARHLEAAGIATVILGCAKDIVEQAGVPRFLFSDFPLGNPAGRPHDPASQHYTLRLALMMLENVRQARSTLISPLRWSEDPAWKLDYCNLARMSPQEIEQRRQAFERQKRIAQQMKEAGEG